MILSTNSVNQAVAVAQELFLTLTGSFKTLARCTVPYATETTLLFADLKGFTAWSSVREPSQVFTLLEVLYNTFDKIAKKRKIFKV